MASGVRTVNDLIDYYLREVLPTKAASTQASSIYIVQKFRTTFGTLPLSHLSPTFLRQWRDELGHWHKHGSVRRYMEALSAVLTVAHTELAWIPEHPMRKGRLPAASPGRVRFLSPDERDRLLAACQASRSPHLFTLVILGLYTGCRKNELRCLTWPQVDLEKACLRLTVTKNKTTRIVPVVGLALEQLTALAAVRRPTVPWVFGRTDGTRPVDVDNAWEGAKQRAGITDFRFHDLRHTAASYLAMSGASLIEIADILGHKTMQMVKRYSHLSDAHTAAVV
jgi:integrase